MMGLFSQAGTHIRRARGLSVEDRPPEDTEPDDTSILCVLSSSLYSPIVVTPSLHSHSPSTSLMGYTDTNYVYRDENEGSIITSLISQLRFASVRPRPTCALANSPLRFQSRHGPLKGDIPDVRSGASQHARTYHGLHVPPGPHLWVRVSRCLLMSSSECPKTHSFLLCRVVLASLCVLALPSVVQRNSARRTAQTPKKDSFACCSIILQDGTSSQRVSRNRASPPVPHSPRQTRAEPSGHRYNPVLGEFFRCRYDYPNGTQGFYVAEQGRLPGVSLVAAHQASRTRHMQCPITLPSPPSFTYHPRTVSPSSAN